MDQLGVNILFELEALTYVIRNLELSEEEQQELLKELKQLYAKYTKNQQHGKH